MPETKVNPSLFRKFKKTLVNSVQKLPDITGHTLDKFHVDSRLDIVSGEADIYLCSRVNDKSGKRFLLKYYRRENAVKPDVIEKLKAVNSPYVAKVEGFGEYEGHQYVVRPYYEMSALSELLAEGTMFSEEELKKLIIPSIIEGLRAVHDAGILHKDLKPANLIPDDLGEHIVLIDFGISSDAGKNTFVMTQTGMTPLYAAPEAIQGIFHRETDYYALGITIFELFTGFTPFQNPELSPEDVARLATVNKIEFPDNFPENLKKLVLGLTYKDISHRNEKNNPNRRWGYGEVKRWLKGEDVPVPSSGEISEAFSKAFPPYRFNGVTFYTENDLIKAFIKKPEEGIKELGRGFLTHHYFSIDERKGTICEKAEKLIEQSENKTEDFMNFLYSLAPSYDGFGTAVFGDSEYEFRNAEEFNSYIERLDRERNLYELKYLFNSYRKALKAITTLVWPSDVYHKLENMVAPIIQFGDRLFRDDASFKEYLESIIANNERTPYNIKYFAIEHKNSLVSLKSRSSLVAVIERIEQYEDLADNGDAIVTIDGVKYPVVIVGDYIKFGSYPQRDDATKTPIEWLVLNVSGNEAFLVSRYGLDCKRYHNSSARDVTWKTCDLRKWLNNDFLKEAFSADEKQRIKLSDVMDEDDPGCNTSGGNNTRDRVFCLSLAEAKRYFKNDDERKCLATHQAQKHRAHGPVCWWYLRSGARVGPMGRFVECGYRVCSNESCVRPALWVHLDQPSAAKQVMVLL